MRMSDEQVELESMYKKGFDDGVAKEGPEAWHEGFIAGVAHERSRLKEILFPIEPLQPETIGTIDQKHNYDTCEKQEVKAKTQAVQPSKKEEGK